MTVQKISDHDYQNAVDSLRDLGERDRIIMKISALRECSATVATNNHHDLSSWELRRTQALNKPKLESSIAFTLIYKAKRVSTAIATDFAPSPAFEYDPVTGLKHSATVLRLWMTVR